MSDEKSKKSSPRRWAELRFAVVGPLLAAPPLRGELQKTLVALAQRRWQHPSTGAPVSFGVSTLERWLGRARGESRDRVGVLARRVRKDRDSHPSFTVHIEAVLRRQWEQHKGWTVKLHYDNLRVLAQTDERLRLLPSYPTVVRYMKRRALRRIVVHGPRFSPGAQVATARLEAREVRSFEVEYVNQLWHTDFHSGSRSVLLTDGRYVTPRCLCVIDDHSRLCCHVQWYLAEDIESFAHGLGQAFLKHGLPAALMTDNGSAMTADETREALGCKLGVIHEHTLPYSPYQNAKQEFVWTRVEGRLMAMLEGVRHLDLATLNEATCAWADLEYNRTVHDELGTTPLDRFLAGSDVGRPAPTPDELRFAFMQEQTRSLRRSDGTVKVDGRRFEIPSAYRTLPRPRLRWASWDLSRVFLVDEATGKSLTRIYPQDKTRNADGYRRVLAPVADPAGMTPPASLECGVAPLLGKLMADYKSRGLAPAYLPKDDLAGHATGANTEET